MKDAALQVNVCKTYYGKIQWGNLWMINIKTEGNKNYELRGEIKAGPSVLKKKSVTIKFWRKQLRQRKPGR